MGNTRYGGRYSDNFIEDITPPEHQHGLVPVRENMDNFRPFEEVADNFINTSPIPPKARKVAEAESAYAVPIDNQATEQKSAGYTYVPPISTLRPETEAAANDQPSFTDKLAQYVTGFVAAWVIRPYRAVVNFWDEHVLTRKYSVDEGAGYRFDRDAEDSLIAAGIGALLIAGLLVVSYGLLDNEVKRGNQGSHNSHTTSSQQSVSGAGGKEGGTSSNTSASGSNTSAAAPAAPVSSTSGTSSSPTTILQGGTSTLTGGMGGGTTSTSPGTGSTSTTNPTSIVPYESVTIPPTTVQVDGKPLLSTDGTTITTN
jgi:hypothetical protein